MKKTTVGQGPNGVDEAYLLVRASVTRTPADTRKNTNNSRCRLRHEDGYHQATDEGIDCVAWDVTKNVW